MIETRATRDEITPRPRLSTRSRGIEPAHAPNRDARPTRCEINSPPRSNPTASGTQPWASRLAVVALLSLTASALAQTQPSPTTAPAPALSDNAAYQQFVFAYRLLQRGEDKLATDAFDEYLRLYPNDDRRGDAIYYRALLARRAGDDAAATKLLADCPAPKLLPAATVPLLRAQVYCELNKFDAALAVLEKINADTAEPAVKAQLLYFTATAYRGTGNLAGALKAFDAAAAAAVDSPLKALALLEEARVADQMSKPADAVAILARSLAAKDPETEAAAALLAGDLSTRLGKYPQAVAFYQTVIASHQTAPQFGPAVIGTLWAQLSDHQYDAVLKSYKDVRPALSPADGFTADYLAASALQDSGKHADAVTALQSLLATAPLPDQPRDKATYKLALSLFELNRFDEMTKAVTAFTTTFPQSTLIPDVDYLQAVADVKRGDPASGVARLTAIIGQGDKNPYYARALLHRAELYEATNLPQPAVEDYRKFLANAAQTTPVPDAALFAEASLRLTDLLTRLGQFDEAQKTAAALLAQPALSPLTEQEALYRQGLALVKQQKLEPALATFQTLLTKHPENRYLAESRYYRGLLLAGLQHPDEATPDLLAAADSKLPTPLRAQALRVASIRLREKNDPRARTVLQQLATLVTIPGLKPDEMIWLGRALEDANQPIEALKYLAPLLDTKSTAPGPACAEAAFVAGRCLRDAQDYPEAMTAFRRVIALNHGFELQAHLELARTMVAAKQTDAALTEYAGLISAEPSAIASAAIYESAQIQLQRAQERKLANETEAYHHQLLEAHKLLKRLVLLYPFPQLSPIPELSYLQLADIEQELGQPDGAAAELRELGDRFPDGPYAVYGRAVLLQQLNKKTEAAALLKTLHEQKLDPRLSQRVDRRLQALETSP